MSYQIITRGEWGARYGRGYPMDGAKTRAILHHDGFDRSKPDLTIEQESALVRFYEDFYVNGEPGKPGLTRANPRIAYSWIVMQTGRIYEGCGWGRIGAHTAGLNSSAYAWVFPLNGAVTAPTPAAVGAFRWHLTEGVRLGHLTPNFVTTGHQDHGKPSCPGKLVYDIAVLGISPVATPPRLIEVIRAHPTLRLGKGGESASFAERAAVMHLQQRLIQTGFMKPKLGDGRTSAATGFFGTKTFDAVVAFQRAKGLLPDGVVGSKTWSAVDAAPQ